MDALRIARQSAGLTQEAVAEMLDTDQATISRYERGLHTPKISRLKVLARIYGRTIGQLLALEPLQ